jgi:hypothetical protein
VHCFGSDPQRQRHGRVDGRILIVTLSEQRIGVGEEVAEPLQQLGNRRVNLEVHFAL